MKATTPHGEPLRSIDDCRILVDGTVGEVRLDHPECVIVGPDGAVWCGGERGQVYRVEADGSGLREVATTGGFSLGMAFGPDGRLYVCDLATASVKRVDVDSGAVETFATGTPERPLVAPNYPLFDAAGRLYVSDSGSADRRGPGIYRFTLDGGAELWHAGPLAFANGLALDADERFLYVVETFGQQISRIAIEPDGAAGAREPFAALEVLADGIAFDDRGRLYVGCYEPSQVLRVEPDGTVRTLVADATAHTLCHPTNVALLGDTLLTANLGRWHITSLDLDSEEK